MAHAWYHPAMAGRSRIARQQRPRSAFREELLNLPNSLTMGRVAIIPLVMWYMSQSDDRVVGLWEAKRAAFLGTVVFAAASIT